MIRKVMQCFTSQHRRFPRVGQWYSTPEGHVLRISLVDRECQKVVCELPGRNYRISMLLITFHSGKNLKHQGGAA